MDSLGELAKGQCQVLFWDSLGELAKGQCQVLFWDSLGELAKDKVKRTHFHCFPCFKQWIKQWRRCIGLLKTSPRILIRSLDGDMRPMKMDRSPHDFQSTFLMKTQGEQSISSKNYPWKDKSISLENVYIIHLPK